MACGRGSAKDKEKGRPDGRAGHKAYGYFDLRNLLSSPVETKGLYGAGEPRLSETQFRYLSYPILTQGNSKFHPWAPVAKHAVRVRDKLTVAYRTLSRASGENERG